MVAFYWICLITGVLFTIVTLFIGELIGHAFGSLFHGMDGGHLLPVLQPVSLIGGITAFGACGFARYQHR